MTETIQEIHLETHTRGGGHTEKAGRERGRGRDWPEMETMDAPNCQQPTDTTKGKALRRSVVLPPW